MSKIPPKISKLYHAVTLQVRELIGEETNKILPLFGGAVVVLATVVGVFAYQFGEREGRSSYTVATDHKGDKITAEDIQNISLENTLLKSEVSALIQERDISITNLNLMREDVQALRAERDELKALNDVLIATAQSTGEPAQVLDVKIDVLADKTFEYRVDILIPTLTEQHFEPKLTLLNATSMVEIPLKPSTYQTKGLVTVRGKFVMPEGFTPKQLRLMMTVGDKKITRLYNWRAN